MTKEARMADFKPQTENLYRGLHVATVDGRTFRGLDLLRSTADMEDDDAETGGDGSTTVAGTTMTGHFAVFNEWTEICSWYEGEFLERIAPKSFRKTIADNSQRIVVQFDHGYSELVGSTPLGVIDVLREDDIGPYYEVPLYDTAPNKDVVLPLLQGRLMDGTMTGSAVGASFRFNVLADSWVMEPKVSAYNPKGLPERTITQVRLMEFGPVVFPAYPSATAMCSSGMRSLSDHYLEQAQQRRSTRSAEPPQGHSSTTPSQEPPTGHSTTRTRALAVALNTTQQLRRAS
jgi:phage head maturation protease